jgi:hypothetical protein
MRSHGWIWFFLLLFTMAGAGITWEIVYNLGLQLPPEQLASARARWAARGPRDYDLEYQVRIDRDPDQDEYVVHVRGGQVISVLCNGEPVPAAERDGHAVEGLFRVIEEGLARDAHTTGRRNYATATFDARDGHPIRYIRRVSGTSERLAWNVVRLQPVLELETPLGEVPGRKP